MMSFQISSNYWVHSAKYIGLRTRYRSTCLTGLQSFPICATLKWKDLRSPRPPDTAGFRQAPCGWGLWLTSR